LHEVATGKRPDQRPLVEMLQGTAVHFQQGWVTALQPKERTITLQNESGQQTSSLANIYCRIESVQLDTSILSRELPTN
jgi:NADH dehydrogenase FAD-containing subunit